MSEKDFAQRSPSFFLRNRIQNLVVAAATAHAVQKSAQRGAVLAKAVSASKREGPTATRKELRGEDIAPQNEQDNENPKAVVTVHRFSSLIAAEYVSNVSAAF